MDFEWDDAKSEWNKTHRGFGFDVVREFDWDGAVVEEDERMNYGEQRFRAFGRAGDLNLFIAFTPRANAFRIISVRRMHRKEANRYGL